MGGYSKHFHDRIIASGCHQSITDLQVLRNCGLNCWKQQSNSTCAFNRFCVTHSASVLLRFQVNREPYDRPMIIGGQIHPFASVLVNVIFTSRAAGASVSHGRLSLNTAVSGVVFACDRFST